MTTENGVLSSERILTRLSRGEIFRKGTWSEVQVRASSYDLRIAEDFLVVPHPDFPRGRRYPRGQPRTDSVVLRPGDVAFVSTRERLCIPWDIAGFVGPKFTYARKGVLILTGVSVDPGFGLRLVEGTWVPKDDERLHFVLANVGSNDVVFKPGEQSIATLQLVGVVGSPKQIDVPSTTDMEREFFDERVEPRLSLSFFRDMAEMRSHVDQFGARLEAIEKASNQLVMFGVYLVFAAVLVSGSMALLTLVSTPDLEKRINAVALAMPTTWPGALVIASFLFAFGASVLGAVRLVRAIWAKWSTRTGGSRASS